MKITITVKDTGEGKVSTTLGIVAMKAIAQECIRSKGQIADASTNIPL